MIKMDSREDKIIGCILGGAIGDSLGYEKDFKPKNKIITDFEGKERISSNTQMTLFTANGIIWRETRWSYKGIAPLPRDALYYAYTDWLDTQINSNKGNNICWIKHIPQLNINRTPGKTCIESLSNGKGTMTEPINTWSRGCGAITRSAPIGIYYMKGHIAKFTEDICALTHGNPLAIIPSIIFTTMINILVNTDKTIKIALYQAIDECKEECYKINRKDTNYFLKLVDIAVKLAKLNIPDEDAIGIFGRGYLAEETFIIALYSCLKYKDSFKDAIICAINHQGNSKGTGSLTGNIIGAYLGYYNIPRNYTVNVELKDVIIEIAQDLTKAPPDFDMKWDDKYVYNKIPSHLK